MKQPTTLLLTLAAALVSSSMGSALAQSAALSGLLGGKALLVVDGSPPKSVAAGETYLGVKVISTQGDLAVVEIAGQRQTLRLGQSPVNAGQAGSGNGKIVLHAESNGHFMSQGKINGRAVNFMVDTGASMVSLSVADAERVGLNYRTGQLVQMSTANGVTPAWKLKLASVRVASVDVYDVDAVVSPMVMPYILLGNSFLTRFQMTRTNDQMVLEKRY